MDTPPGSRELLRQARSFCAKKRLGQHFLVDADVLDHIAEAMEISNNDPVIEIGPGLGFLTRHLIGRGAHVDAVDLDRESCNYLKELKLKNTNIKHGDFLAYDLNSKRFTRSISKTDEPQTAEQPDFKIPQEKLKIAGNIPYQITGLIIAHTLGEIGQPAPWFSRVERIVLMVQKEVAHRMIAQPGSKDYSHLTLLINYFASASLVEVVPRTAFYPAPRVDSAVVVVKPKAIDVDCRDHAFLAKVMKVGFKGRRKMLRNALSALPLPAGCVDQSFQQLDIDPQVRAEELSLQQFAMLANALEANSK